MKDGWMDFLLNVFFLCITAHYIFSVLMSTEIADFKLKGFTELEQDADALSTSLALIRVQFHDYRFITKFMTPLKLRYFKVSSFLF